MIARLSPALLCLALLASPATAQDASASTAAPLTCDGAYAAVSSEARLSEIFGADNVVTGTIPGVEGMDVLATTVFPDDADRTMVFGWWDETSLSMLSYVDIARDQIAPGGVRLGMTVEKVVALNGEAFIIGGFGWDYGGYARIESGNLAHAEGTCYVSIRFDLGEEYDGEGDITAISGEVDVPTGEPLLKTVDAKVGTISLGYPDPAYVEPDAAE